MRWPTFATVFVCMAMCARVRVWERAVTVCCVCFVLTPCRPDFFIGPEFLMRCTFSGRSVFGTHSNGGMIAAPIHRVAYLALAVFAVLERRSEMRIKSAIFIGIRAQWQ